MDFGRIKSTSEISNCQWVNHLMEVKVCGKRAYDPVVCEYRFARVNRIEFMNLFDYC